LATDVIIPENVLKRLNTFPKEIRLKFWDQLERLVKDPSYPSLRNEKIQGADQWAFSITMNYRASYIRTEHSIIITAIGTHKHVLGN
jgi:mRNA-degrading endonuclease RelE of RelBE toxin-antitoxin system